MTVFQASTGQLETILRGDSLRIWMPIGWSSGGALAYRDTKGVREVLWLHFPGAESLTNPPALPLRLNAERIRNLLPAALAGSWTGDFSLSPDERFLAIACRDDETRR